MNTRNIVVALLVLAVVAAGWFLVSPLFIDQVVDEPLAELGVTRAEIDEMTPAEREKLMSDMMQEASQKKRAVDEPMAKSMGESPIAVAVGRFRDGDAFHKGSGRVSLYRLPDGSHAIRVEDFEVTNGPALVVLMAGAVDPQSAEDVKAFNIKLGELKGNIGNQNYFIPAGINVGQFRSVVIWCELFDVIFSSATMHVT